MTSPSRHFLIQQAVLNALDLEMRETSFTGSAARYAHGRCRACFPRSGWQIALPWGFENIVRAKYRALVAQYGEPDA